MQKGVEISVTEFEDMLEVKRFSPNGINWVKYYLHPMREQQMSVKDFMRILKKRNHYAKY